jgi:hypothetical protein
MATFKVLSIDGGGIRGIIPAHWFNAVGDRTGIGEVGVAARRVRPLRGYVNRLEARCHHIPIS